MRLRTTKRTHEGTTKAVGLVRTEEATDKEAAVVNVAESGT